MLNDTLEWQDVPDEHRSAFRGRQAEKVQLARGQVLYKRTSRTFEVNCDNISPWWSQDEPKSEEFARARFAVRKDWSGNLTLIVKVILGIEAMAFYGQCSGQPMWSPKHKNANNVVFIGGARQIYLPNLKREHLAQMVYVV